MQLQHATLSLACDLDQLNRMAVTRILGIGRRGRAMKLAAEMLYARSRTVKQAGVLRSQVEEAMAACGRNPG
jgi:hypothetical protein